jgi:hypothetical protein
MNETIEGHAKVAIDQTATGDFETGEYDTCVVTLVDYEITEFPDLGVAVDSATRIQAIFHTLFGSKLFDDDIKKIARMNEKYGLEEGFLNKSIDDENLALNLEMVFEWNQ